MKTLSPSATWNYLATSKTIRIGWQVVGTSRICEPRRFAGRVPQGLPINFRHPALLVLVATHHSVGEQVVRLSLFVSVIGIERESQPIPKVQAMPRQVSESPGAGQTQTILVVQV